MLFTSVRLDPTTTFQEVLQTFAERTGLPVQNINLNIGERALSDIVSEEFYTTNIIATVDANVFVRAQNTRRSTTIYVSPTTTFQEVLQNLSLIHI